ncbi:2646_t:CDS:2, partial [Funneliformis caledonium]
NLGSLKIGHFNEKSGLIKSIVTRHYKAILSLKVKKKGSLAGLVCIGGSGPKPFLLIQVQVLLSFFLCYRYLYNSTHNNTYVAGYGIGFMNNKILRTWI